MKDAYILITILLFSIQGYCQQSKSFTLSDPIPATQTKNMVARDFIYMKNNYPDAGGFFAKPDIDNQVHAKIDPMLVLPPHDGTTGGAPNNWGGKVGSLPGEFDVTSFGACNYDIPIELPEGIGGLTPELRFIYNSQSGDGIMGDGWSLSGISKISRVPYSYYYNSFTASVMFDNNDQLSLDGNYLRKNNEGEYKLEVEDFSKIVPINESDINDGFIVYKSNGYKYYYGTDEQSRYYLQSGSPIAWYLTKIYDLNNNYIEFHYHNDKPDGSFYPDYILYTGNSNAETEPFYKVSFEYLVTERTDSPRKYFTNPDNSQPLYSRITKYLSEVVVTYIPTSKNIIDFTLCYHEEGFIEKKYLCKIIPTFDCNATRSTNNYNPTNFEWFHSNYILDSEENILDLDYNDEIEMFKQESVIACNFVNRGIDDMPLTDLLHISKTHHDNQYFLRAYINESRYGTNNFDFRLGNASGTTPYKHYKFPDAHKMLLISTGDFNGDGFDEIIRIFVRNDDLYVALGNFNFDEPPYNYSDFYNKKIDGYDSNKPLKFALGDFSGNGYDDLCLIYYNDADNAYCHFYLSNKNDPLGSRIETTIGGPNFQFPEKILIGDFNGNLKKEIVVIGDDNSSIISLHKDNALITVTSLSTDFDNYNNSDDYIAGDFNNDAKTDILWLNSDVEDNWTFYFSYGKGKFVKHGPLTIENIGSSGAARIATDLNGDGYTDLCWVWYNWIEGVSPDTKGYYRKDFLINPSNNDIQITKLEYEDPIATIVHAQEKSEIDFCIGNFSGNSNSQLISSCVKLIDFDLHAKINLSAPLKHSYINSIEKITNGYGVETLIHYCPFSAIPFSAKKQFACPYDDSKSYSFPINDYKGILNVVTSYEVEVDESFSPEHEQKFMTVNYIYSGAKYHKLGKGFLGFDLVQQINNITQTYTNRYYNIDNLYFHIVNNKNETFQITNSKIVSTEENEYTFLGLNDPEFIRYSCKPSVKTVKHYDETGASGLKKRIKTTFKGYDSYGNPDTVTKYFSITEDTWPLIEEHKTDYLNINNSNLYITGLPDYLEITHRSQEDENRIYKIDNVFNNSTGLLKSVTYEPQNTKAYTVSYIYDEGLNTFGNVTQIKYSASTGIEPRIWNYKFDESGRFLKETRNPLDHTELFDYYHFIGKLKNVTDANSMVTSFEYDIFGKIEKIIYPNGTYKYNVNRWCVEGSQTPHEDAPEKALYYNWSAEAGSPEILTFYDQFNRILRIVKTGFDGTKIYHDTKYFGQTPIFAGLKNYESIPYFKPSDPSFEPAASIYTYNVLQQLKTVIRPDGSSKTINYSKNTKTIKDFDNLTKKLEYDGANRLIKVTDNNETIIDYCFRSDNLLKSTKVDSNMATMIEYIYDDFRHPLTINKPNNGITTYTYNAFGDLVTEIDQENSNSYTVDKLGRIIESTVEDETNGYTTVWEYDTQRNGIGKLHYVVHAPNSGYIQSAMNEYFYNEKGYMYKQKQTLNAEQLAFEYTYDIYGRIKQTIWPSDFKTTNNYNEYGRLVSILDNYSNQLWKAKKMNAIDQYTKTVLGTCVDKETTYDLNNGYITDIVSRNINNYQYLQSHNYLWYSNGNLEHRRDNILNITETFYYDQYNRLTHAYINNVEQLNLQFEKIGNIHNKSDLGEYTYDFGKPHALQEIPGTPESISQNYQSINYTPFDKVYHISEKENADSDEDLLCLDIGYGPNHERVWQKFNDNIENTSLEKRYFNSIYEEQIDDKGNKKKLHYLSSPTGLFAIFTVTNDEDLKMNYILKDHLGSINYILDGNGNIEQKLNYDAWGRRREPDTWQYYTSSTTPPEPVFDRGFTLHEHLDAFKLINMNGRMYDPVIARFLSPDPIIQFPHNTQSYNSYSYVLNNPLKYTDPSGFALDWFQNEITGDVYYNSAYKESDKNKMKGDGWTYLGKNGMFSDNTVAKDPVLSDLEVLSKNQTPIARHFKESGNGAFTVEAVLRGKNASEFMSKQGYNWVSTQKTIFERTTGTWLQGPGNHSFTITTGEVVEITEKSKYLKNDYMEIGRIQKTVPIFDNTYMPIYSMKAARYTITYTNNQFTKIVTKMLSAATKLNGTHDMRNVRSYKSWSVYKENIDLIDKLIKKHEKGIN